MKKNKRSKSWIINQHRDQYFKKSKILGYRSRSAFKLIEINKKFKLLNNNTNLIDLGSAPGGWSQVASQIITKGLIIAIDTKEMKNIKNVNFIRGDILNDNTKDKIISKFGGKIDVIISDMAANTTGNKDLDCIRTNNLCLEIINLSKLLLKNNGSIVSKIFMGQDFLEIKKKAKTYFKKVVFFKPNSSRDNSKETYIHCKTLNTL
jgi:23S rRNA (uridine2552-2'-O)-methyltransferase